MKLRFTIKDMLVLTALVALFVGFLCPRTPVAGPQRTGRPRGEPCHHGLVARELHAGLDRAVLAPQAV